MQIREHLHKPSLITESPFQKPYKQLLLQHGRWTPGVRAKKAASSFLPPRTRVDACKGFAHCGTPDTSQKTLRPERTPAKRSTSCCKPQFPKSWFASNLKPAPVLRGVGASSWDVRAGPGTINGLRALNTKTIPRAACVQVFY